jgi:hypothetical protein
MSSNIFLKSFWISILCFSAHAQASEEATIVCAQSDGNIALDKATQTKNHQKFQLLLEPLSIKGKAGFSRLSCSVVLPLRFSKPRILTQVELKIFFEQHTPEDERNSLSQLKFMAQLFEGMAESGKEESQAEWVWSEKSPEKSEHEIHVLNKGLKKCSKEHRLRSHFSALIQGKPALAFDAYKRGLKNTQVSLKASEKVIGSLLIDSKECVE